MSDDVCLAVDLGTSGLKVGLVGVDGAVIEVERRDVATRFGPDGEASQDAEAWWRDVAAASRGLLARTGVAPGRVVALGVTGQYASTVPVDASGRPTGRCLTWLDTRGRPMTRAAIGGPVMGYRPLAVARFVRRSGGAPSLSGADPVGHLLYLAATDPELVERTRWFLEPVDYLTMRATGVASATLASRVAMWLTDNRRLDRLAYDARLAASVGVGLERLPPLVPFGSVVGELSREGAEDLGLTTRAVVVTGMPDVHAGAVGSGATGLYQAHLAISTTSWISCPVPRKKTDALHSIATAPGLSPGGYLMIDNQETGGRALDWLRDALGGRHDHDELTAMAAESPPGARGVTFAPWLAGERSPAEDKRARGAFTGLSLTTTTGDLVRAVLEGVAANSAWLLGHAERFAGRRLEPLRALGGGAQSRLWCQVFADATQRTVVRTPEPLAAQLRGAARVAAAAVGGPSLGDLAGAPAEGEDFTPDADGAGLWAARAAALPELFKRARRDARRG